MNRGNSQSHYPKEKILENTQEQSPNPPDLGNVCSELEEERSSEHVPKTMTEEQFVL